LKYTLGTRGSQLSLAQTRWVIKELESKNPDTQFEIKTIKTKGDVDERPLFTIDQKGIFEKEIDKAVSDGEVDFAVHSMKDVPSQLAEGLEIACVPIREKVNDIFISGDSSTLETIRTGATIGTSSLRRAVQISRKRPDLVVKPIRGNIETRVRKVIDGNFDAIVLAQAGISRLGLDVKFTPLSTTDFFPSPGQGALAIVARSDDQKIIPMLKKIEDENSRLEVEAERALSRFVESGCRFPVGAYAKADEASLSLKVVAFSVDGSKSLKVEKSGNRSSPEQLGRQVGEELQGKGVNELAANWREKVEEWNKK